MLKRLEDLMYGYNYVAGFGYDELGSIESIDKALSKIQEMYKGAKPYEEPVNEVKINVFWEDINYGFNYRGDEGHGLELEGEKEKEVIMLQSEYRKFISSFINDDSLIYEYPNNDGLPEYPIYWGYKFIIINKKGNSLFLYGAASD